MKVASLMVGLTAAQEGKIQNKACFYDKTLISAVDERLVNFQRLPRVFDWYEELIRLWFYFLGHFWAASVIKLHIFSYLIQT